MCLGSIPFLLHLVSSPPADVPLFKLVDLRFPGGIWAIAAVLLWMRFAADSGLRQKLLATTKLKPSEVVLFLMVLGIAIWLPFGTTILWIDPLPMLLSVLVVISLSRIPLGLPTVLVTLLAALGSAWLLVPELASLGERWGVLAGLLPGGTIAAFIALLVPRASLARMSWALGQNSAKLRGDRPWRGSAAFSILLPLLAGASAVLSTLVLSHPDGVWGDAGGTPALPIETGLIVSFFTGLVASNWWGKDGLLSFGAMIVLAAAIVMTFDSVFEGNYLLSMHDVNSFASFGYFAGIGANVALCAVFWSFGLLTRKLAMHASRRVAGQSSFDRRLQPVAS
jgi:hypothetical protein